MQFGQVNGIIRNAVTKMRLSVMRKLRDEITVVHSENGPVLLRGTRLCIPTELQQNTVNLSHEGHMGRLKCLLFLRDSVYFPYMDTMVDNMCKKCIPCMAASSASTPDPIKSSELPAKPFDEISVDFCGKFPSGEYYMVVKDDYSRNPIVEKLTNITAQTVIPRLETVFSMFGIPSVVRTDNGPPFQSQAFADFAEQMGFKHRKITPYHPMGNAIAESFMKPLQKAIKTAKASGKNHRRELNTFLMNYRSTPHPSTGLSLAEIMFRRKVKTRLPNFQIKNNDKYIRQRDKNLKDKNKRYADIRRKSKTCTLKPGARVLIKQTINNKLDTPFNPVPGMVVSRKGSMINARHNGKNITRDASHFKFVGD